MPMLRIGDVGPCQVVWDWGPVATATNLVITPYLGTISLRMVDSVSDVQEEGWGDSIKDSVFAGTVMELDVPMARSTMTQLRKMLHDRTVAPSIHETVLWPRAGCDMYADAEAILIQPLCDGVPSSERKQCSVLLKCYPWRDFELTWDRSAQRVHMVHFKVFQDQDSGAATPDAFGTEGIAAGGLYDLAPGEDLPS